MRKLLREPGQQRSGMISVLAAVNADVEAAPAVLQLQYRSRTIHEILAPLGQSVERIHGKENTGAILLVR
jgi:hypothetical protein